MWIRWDSTSRCPCLENGLQKMAPNTMHVILDIQYEQLHYAIIFQSEFSNTTGNKAPNNIPKEKWDNRKNAEKWGETGESGGKWEKLRKRDSENGGKWEKMWRLGNNWRASQAS